MLLAQLRPAVTMIVLSTAVLGLAYPLAMTGVGQALFPHQANGSLIVRDGRVIGSELVGQSFEAPQYLRPRPSAAGDGYDAANSSGTNLGPTNAAYIAEVRERAAAIAAEDGAAPPVGLVTASGSGLDPHVSPASALLQARRIAEARGADLAAVETLIESHVEGRRLGLLGEPVVNVLAVNLDLDARLPAAVAPTEDPGEDDRQSTAAND